MANLDATDYGIKYKNIKLNDNLFLLMPISLVEGYGGTATFYSNKEHKIAETKEILEKEKTVIDSIVSVENLKKRYDFDDIEFIKDYYFEEERENILLIEIKEGKLYKRKINLSKLVQNENTELYERQKDTPVISLNCDALETLLNIDESADIKENLLRFQKLINDFRDREQKESLTSIKVTNGKVSEININKGVKGATPQIVVAQPGSFLENGRPRDYRDYSIHGLEQYLKERIFGHDEEIKRIATRMLMNYRSTPEYGTEIMLIAGPTGTGKTETGMAAAEYLNLPFIKINSPNLVPQGIKGTSLEDCMYSLLKQSCNIPEKAERGYVFLDEFDKIGLDDLDTKKSVKNILLSFIEGDKFLLEQTSDDYEFDTRMLNKIIAGAFMDLFEQQKKPLGFRTDDEPEELVFDPKRIEQSHYFGKELISRIQHKYIYKPLTREIKKKIILTSKLSVLQKKKRRYEEEFNIELVALDEYIESILERLRIQDKSMRDLNNIILETLSEVEYQLLANEGKVKKLILTADTVTNPQKFDLL